MSEHCFSVFNNSRHDLIARGAETNFGSSNRNHTINPIHLRKLPVQMTQQYRWLCFPHFMAESLDISFWVFKRQWDALGLANCVTSRPQPSATRHINLLPTISPTVEPNTVHDALNATLQINFSHINYPDFITPSC